MDQRQKMDQVEVYSARESERVLTLLQEYQAYLTSQGLGWQTDRSKTENGVFKGICSERSRANIKVTLRKRSTNQTEIHTVSKTYKTLGPTNNGSTLLWNSRYSDIEDSDKEDELATAGGRITGGRTRLLNIDTCSLNVPPLVKKYFFLSTFYGQ